MGKIFDLFDDRHKKGKMYRESPVNKAHGVNRIKEDGDGHPLHYVYPDGIATPTGRKHMKLMDSVKDDVVLGEGSVSHLRDIARMHLFGQSLYGRKFLQSQKDLQRKNPWAQTRRYREDNVKDHTEDPNLHQQRHGRSLSSLKRDFGGILGEFAAEGNNGRLQTETSYALTKEPGPVKYRMESPEGMLNTGGLTLVGNAASAGRGWLVDKVNEWSWLSGATRYLSDIRGTYTDTTVSDRPEIQYGYLEKIYAKNRGLKDFYGLTHGHIYLNLPENDDTVTYFDNHLPSYPDEEGSGENMGLLGYSQLRPGGQKNRIATRLYDNILSTIEDTVGDLLTNVGLKLLGDSRALRDVRSFVSRSLPRFNDIEFFNTLREVTVDIDKFIAERRNLLSTVFGTDAKQITLIPTNLKDRYLMGPDGKWSQILYDVEGELFGGVSSPKLQNYIDEVENYKKSNNKISLGFGAPGDNTTGVPGFDKKRVFKASPAKYYKDYTQDQNSIYKRDIAEGADTDSIDVIFRVLGKSKDEDVRFRAFIEDINEAVTPTYNEIKYIGRYETHYTYDRVTRDLSFTLRLQAFSVKERDHIMSKMAYLTSLAYPESTNTPNTGGMGYLTPLVTQLTIGRVYRQQPCIVQTLNHSIEGDTSWDIDHQTPMSILVSLGVRLLDKKHYTHGGMKNTIRPFQLYLRDFMSDMSGMSLTERFEDELLNLDVTRLDPSRKAEVALQHRPITATPLVGSAAVSRFRGYGGDLIRSRSRRGR